MRGIQIHRLKWMFTAAILGSVSLGSVSSQVTYTQSTVHVSEFDFDIKNVTVDGSGNVYYYTLARLIEKVSSDGAYTNLSGFGSTVIKGISPPETSAGTPALEVALQMQDNNANLLSDSDGNLFFYQDGLILELRASDQMIYRRSGGGAFKTAWTLDGTSGIDGKWRCGFQWTCNVHCERRLLGQHNRADFLGKDRLHRVDHRSGRGIRRDRRPDGSGS